MSAQFIFTVCQPGSEAALKHEIAREHSDFRFAFSRPGFVTFRVPAAAAVDSAPSFRLKSVFARTWGFSLGRLAGKDRAKLARELWRALAEQLPAERIAALRHLHVWPRERALPGDTDFDPALLADAQAIGEALLEQRPPAGRPPALNGAATGGDEVLDCVAVEPNEWWFGWHRAGSPHTQWPGGVPGIAAPASMVSRAYLKLAEALLWSQLPLRTGDRCVEIGSAPGGSCQLLLERGCVVTGIDPAEMDPRVAASPQFTHLRARAKDLKRGAFEGFRWLMSDANVAPNYTLDTVEAIVTWPKVQFEGLVLTLKLTDPALTAALPALVERIASWGYRRVRMRQLAFNRQEVCAVATDRQ